jgi:neurofibromin 1
VFEVASNLREAKSANMAKKIAFLDGLRKALRNRNEQAAYCLVGLLRAARHFDAESESALLSYAMDVQDEVKDAVFQRMTPGSDGVLFDQDIMTAAFVSLAHLDSEHCVASLAETCLAPSAPTSFKISVIQACSHFARLDDSEDYQALFTAASAFIQGQLKVCFLRPSPFGTDHHPLCSRAHILQALSTLLNEAFLGEPSSSQRKVVENPSAIGMICNVLNFLQASPMTLFEGPPDDEGERDRFYMDNFTSLVSCVVSANETVRRLATEVAKRLFAEEILLEELRASRSLNSLDFKTRFWRLRYVSHGQDSMSQNGYG